MAAIAPFQPQRTETNGYLDPDQTIIDYCVRELGCTFQEVIQDDPNRMLRAWQRLRKTGQQAAIAGVGLGGVGVALGVFAGATPLMIAGVSVVALNGWLCKVHADAQEAIAIESDVLNQCRPALDLLAKLEQQGVNASHLVSIYNRLVQFASTNRLAADDPKQLADFFKSSLKQAQMLKALEPEPEPPQATEFAVTVQLPQLQAPVCPQSPPPTSAETRQETPDNNWQPPAVPTDDIARDLASNLRSALVVGQPGAGKGIVVAQAIREIKRQRSDLQIWVIDPKNEPSEAHYWEPADKVLRRTIDPFTSPNEMELIVQDFEEFISRFSAIKAPKLLIVDEVLTIMNKAKQWYQNFLAPGCHALCSTGRAAESYVWLISQSPNAADFGMSGGTRNVYRRLLLVSADNVGLLANGSTFFSGYPEQKLFSATGRVFYDSVANRWGATPVYDLCSVTSFADWLKTNQPATVEQAVGFFGGDRAQFKQEAIALVESGAIAFDASTQVFSTP
jgi:hypothetical protein